MKGLRTDEGSRFEAFFRVVQDEAEKHGRVFFLDAGDGNEFSNDEMDGENLMGWLVQKDEAGAFEDAFSRWEEIPSKFADTFCFVMWENAKKPRITFRFNE